MSDFKKDDGWDVTRETPYVNWWHKADGQLPANFRDFDGGVGEIFFDPGRLFERIVNLRSLVGETPDHSSEMKKILEQFGHGSLVPLPKDSKNPGWPEKPGDLPDWITPEVMERLPDDVPDDAVIVGVIDTGVALGHRAFRLDTGETRVIASWQQTAEFCHQSADYLPFGEEWFAGDINAKLLAHSRNGVLADRLDEDAFNRALRLVEPQRIRGHRDLDHRAAHGTHVMDIAAGGDPASFADADRLRMIVVNLPTQYLHGYAGNFLEFFAGYAVVRVFHLAEALWKKKDPNRPGGYPVALNLAYGMMGGPKDGSRMLEKLMDLFVTQRAKIGLPTSICMPVGNENLARAVARVQTGPDCWSKTIPWRVLPSDRTSNHLEFWFTVTTKCPEDDLDQYTFQITTPTGDDYEIAGPRHGAYADLPGGFARLYCLLHPNENDATHVHFMLATSPTLIIERDEERDAARGAQIIPAPAGVWKIKACSPRPSELTVYVQSDQSATVQSNAGLRSYLDHADYERYQPEGRVTDTYSYTLESPHQPVDLEDPVSLVTRKGTHNALATTRSNSAIAGFRRSDGRPADYSATWYPAPSRSVAQIQAAYPTDDSPALYGVLAAGARDGTSVAFRGTSMAAAMATRAAANAMLAWAQAAKPSQSVALGSADWHERQGADGESEISKTHDHFGRTTVDKTGGGRVLAEDFQRSWRNAPR